MKKKKGILPQIKSNYTFYICYAALPSLYASVNMLKDKNPSYFYSRILSLVNLPDHVKTMTDHQMIPIILNILQDNPDAKFTIFITDQIYLAQTTEGNFLTIHKLLEELFLAKIPLNQVEINIIEDGTDSYDRFHEISTTGTQDYVERMGQQAFQEYNVGIMNTVSSINIATRFYFPSVFKEISYWLAYPEVIFDSDPQLARWNHADANYVKKSAYSIFEELEPENKELFKDLYGLKNKTLQGNQSVEDLFMNNQIPIIVIIGAITPIGRRSLDIQDYVDQVKAYYGRDYSYLYKPHPRDRTRRIPKGIDYVLPLNVNMEALLWSYKDLIYAVGGCQSTIFYNIPNGMQTFMFREPQWGAGHDQATPFKLYFVLEELYRKGSLVSPKYFSRLPN